MRKVVRSAGTYKWQQVPGMTKKMARAFGGINVIMCADFWQLKPVTGTYICSNPAEATDTTQAFVCWGIVLRRAVRSRTKE